MAKLIKTSSPRETFDLGKSLGLALQGGEVICLYGGLGAGKTVLAKGLGCGLGVPEEITSPTFTLIQEYISPQSGLKFVHMDLYRLVYPEEAEVIGVADYFTDDTVCLLEWPEIVDAFLPEDRLEIRIEGSGEQLRTITITPFGTAKNIEFGEAYEIPDD